MNLNGGHLLYGKGQRIRRKKKIERVKIKWKIEIMLLPWYADFVYVITSKH